MPPCRLHFLDNRTVPSHTVGLCGTDCCKQCGVDLQLARRSAWGSTHSQPVGFFKLGVPREEGVSLFGPARPSLRTVNGTECGNLTAHKDTDVADAWAIGCPFEKGENTMRVETVWPPENFSSIIRFREADVVQEGRWPTKRW